MAADCLRSASDDVIRNNGDPDIVSLIEDLYMKLSSLNLLSGIWSYLTSLVWGYS